VYTLTMEGTVTIASMATQTTFYSTRMEKINCQSIGEFKILLSNFIKETSSLNKKEIEAFKS